MLIHPRNAFLRLPLALVAALFAVPAAHATISFVTTGLPAAAQNASYSQTSSLQRCFQIARRTA